jgi:hypothetical protein
MEISTKVNVFLTVNLMIFASIEANSTRKQAFDSAKRYEQEDRRIIIEDLKNELEKSHGILFSIVNNMYLVPMGGDTDEKVSYSFKHHDDKNKIDEIFMKYPFMHSSELREFWNNNIQDLESDDVDGYARATACAPNIILKLCWDGFGMCVWVKFYPHTHLIPYYSSAFLL